MSGMGSILVQFNGRQIEELTARLGASAPEIRRLVRMAINETGRWARAEVVRGLAGAWNLPAGELRRRNVFFHQAITDRLAAEVNIRGRKRGIPLARFAPRPARMSPRQQRRVSGTSVEVRRGARQIEARAFTAQMKSGHVGVFRRKLFGRGGGRKITELRGPTVPDMLAATGGFTAEEVADRVQARLSERLDHIVRQWLNRRGGAGG